MRLAHPVYSESFDHAEQYRLPRRVLRHLISAHDIVVGSRVLTVGQGSASLGRYLEYLGFHTSCFDESAEATMQARTRWPDMDHLYCGRADSELPFTPRQFDLVVLREVEAFAGSLFSAEAFRTTANLLETVRPGGHLCIRARRDAVTGRIRTAHSNECYVQHLSRFPGPYRVHEFPDSLVHSDTVNWLVGWHETPGYLMLSLRVPDEPLDPTDWLMLATMATAASQKLCCEAAARPLQVD